MTRGPDISVPTRPRAAVLLVVLCLGALLVGGARASLAPASPESAVSFADTGVVPEHTAATVHVEPVPPSRDAAATRLRGPAHPAHADAVPCDTPCDPERSCASDCALACAGGCCPSAVAIGTLGPVEPPSAPARPARPRDAAALTVPAASPPFRPPIA